MLAVAAGVSKAHADHVTISGHDGGTGASPLTSVQMLRSLGDRFIRNSSNFSNKWFKRENSCTS